MDINRDIMKRTWRSGAALAGLAVAASLSLTWAAPEHRAPDEVEAFGYAVGQARWIESSGASVRVDVSARVDGVATVDSAGFARARFVLEAGTGTDKRHMTIAISGRGGEPLATMVKVNGQERKASVVLARERGCVNGTCSAAARVRLSDGRGADIDIYIPSADLAPTHAVDLDVNYRPE